MKDKDFLRRRYEAAFKQMENKKEDYPNIKLFVVIAKELANYTIAFREEAICYINRLQYFLFSEDMIPFVVKSIKDGSKIGELPEGDIHDFLSYVWLAYKYVEEDWYWDEKLRRYVSRNRFW